MTALGRSGYPTLRSERSFFTEAHWSSRHERCGACHLTVAIVLYGRILRAGEVPRIADRVLRLASARRGGVLLPTLPDFCKQQGDIVHMALGPGSIAFVGINTSGAADWFAFVAIEAITAGTVVYFTD